MASLSRRIARRLATALHHTLDPRFDEVDERLRALDHKVDQLNHLVVHLDDGIQENRVQVLAARHEAHVLLVTDIDAANEATALLGRSLGDHRDIAETRLEAMETTLDRISESLGQLSDDLRHVQADAAST